MKKKLPLKKSGSLVELAEKGIAHVKLAKDGSYEARKGKKGATHKLVETPTSVVAEPLSKKANKLMVASAASYGPPRIPDEPQEAPKKWHPPIPEGATHLEYSNSHTAIIEGINKLEDYRDFRGGKLRFGRLRYNEDFVSMMPEDAGEGSGERQVVLRKADSPSPGASTSPESKPAKASKAPAGPRPGDIPGKRQNGVLKPGAGGKTARVWEICDQLLAELGRTPTKAEVLAIAVDKEKASPGMATTQHSYWRRFYGHPKP